MSESTNIKYASFKYSKYSALDLVVVVLEMLFDIGLTSFKLNLELILWELTDDMQNV